MSDYLSLLPSTFVLISKWLTSRVGPWWPTWIGALFPLYAATLSFVVWILRGRAWPVRCLYPWTQERWPCENWVAGEWFRCHVHNKVRYYKHHGGHWVDPSIKRWQIGDYSTGTLVDRPTGGIGFIRFNPVDHALLYRNGYARRPLDVVTALPEYIGEGYRRLRTASIRESPDSPMQDLILGRQGVRDATAENLHSVVRATRFALYSFAVALLSSLVGIVLPTPWQSILQWIGTLGFVCAWSALSSGIWQRCEDWLTNSCWKTLKWWLTIFVPVMIINLFLSLATS